MIRYHAACLIPLLAAAMGAGRASAAQGQRSDQTGSSITLACSPDKPVAWPREKIRLRAFTEAGAPLHYEWTVSRGTVDAQAAAATWDFTGVEPGTYTATVRVTGRTGELARCSVKIVVQARSPIRGRETGWSLLVAGREEEKGYGLYSYLLLGSPPTGANRERYLKTIEAFVGLIPDIVNMEKYLSRGELNVTYLPVRVPPPSGSAAPDWLLEHYDYARARFLLSRIRSDRRDGPYIVSVLAPLAGTTVGPSSHLFQDLSQTPADLVSLWAKEFFNQAAQNRFWEPKTANGMVLKMRTTIAVMAEGLPDVKKGLNGWIAWVL